MRSDVRASHRDTMMLVAAAVACALGLGACAGQQAEAHVAPSADAVLVPHARDLSTGGFAAEAAMNRIVADSGPGTTERTIGSVETSIRPARNDGHAALVFTRTSRRGSQEFVDTTLVLRDGLAPVWEVARNSRGWRARFDYDGPTVRVESATPDSTHRATHTYPHAVFDFNELDAIVRSVPLRDGYHTVVALYSEGDDRLELDTISVAAPRAGHAWDVRFADPVIISHYGIDGTTRRITSLEVTYHRTPLRLRQLADSTPS